jgi:hypothetical protein
MQVGGYKTRRREVASKWWLTLEDALEDLPYKVIPSDEIEFGLACSLGA